MSVEIKITITKTQTQLQADKLLKLKLICRFSNINNYNMLKVQTPD